MYPNPQILNDNFSSPQAQSNIEILTPCHQLHDKGQHSAEKKNHMKENKKK